MIHNVLPIKHLFSSIIKVNILLKHLKKYYIYTYSRVMRVINTLLVRRISSKCIQKPVPFHLVPYDEQYETRDFKRNVNSYPSLFKKELNICIKSYYK